jgi:type IV pilus assembly protein PilM
MAELQTKAFDPYHKWLGIRNSQSPPNHYRLLGLELWESDEDVVREAASRQTNHIRSFRSGPHGKLCHQLLEEIREARDTLLDERSKKNYDRMLRRVVNAPGASGDNLMGSNDNGSRGSTAIVTTSTPIECANCGAENLASRQFCGGCGVQLWEPCVECNALCGPADLHCGSCGASVKEALQRRIADLRAILDQSEQLRAEHAYSEAIALLEAVEEHEHPKLASLAERIARSLKQANLDLATMSGRAESAYADSQKLLAKGDFDAATDLIRQLPERFIDDRLLSLLNEIECRHTEATDLGAEIRRRLAERNIDGLLEKVERLSELQPQNVDAQKLLAKLRPLEEKRIETHRNEMSRQAMTAARAHRYAQAVQLLREIPEQHRTAEISKLFQQVSARADEIAWLVADLRQAVVHDDHLLPIAQKLLKLQPDNTIAAKCISILEQQAKPNADRAAAAKEIWPQPPAMCSWGFPLAPVAGFQRLKANAVECAEFKYDPGRFCVAAGLALQALQKSAVSINLAPVEKAGMLSMLKGRKRGPTSAWGIDRGRSAIKAIKVAIDPESKEPAIVAAAFIECTTSGGVGVDSTAAGSELDEFLKQVDLNDSAIAVNVPGEKVFTRFFSIPLIAKNKLGELMHYEVKQQIPFPLETLTWGYHLFDPADAAIDPDAANESAIALLAFKQEDAKACLQPFVDRGVKVEVLQSDVVAFFNLLAYEHFPLSPLAARNVGRSPLIAALEIGAETSNLVLTNGRTFWTRSVPLGGSEFTRSLQREFAFDWRKAEHLKRNPTGAISLQRMYQPLEACFQAFAADVHHSIDQYLTQNTQFAVQKMWVSGGGTKLHGLLRFLQHRR